MGTPEERVQDGMRLTLDAHAEGRLDALEQLRSELLERRRLAGETVEADGNATDRMKARGALEEIDELLGLAEELAGATRTARGA